MKNIVEVKEFKKVIEENFETLDTGIEGIQIGLEIIGLFNSAGKLSKEVKSGVDELKKNVSRVSTDFVDVYRRIDSAVVIMWLAGELTGKEYNKYADKLFVLGGTYNNLAENNPKMLRKLFE